MKRVIHVFQEEKKQKSEIKLKKKAFSLYAEVHRMYILDKPSFCD